MATADFERPSANNRLWLASAAAMALVIVAGFGLQFLVGRSSFSARALVHVHGIIFMGWVAIFAVQAWAATSGPIALHRRVGRLAMLWLPLMAIMGTWITIDVVQRGITPFFFKPQHFLIGNPLSLLVFLGLVCGALILRKRTDWHMRLQISAMAALLGPGFGRLLPMPLMIPWSFEIAGLLGLIFPAIGALRDWRRDGRVHAAWWWGMVGIAAVVPLAQFIATSPAGDAISAAIVAGHPGATVPGMAYPAPPPL